MTGIDDPLPRSEVTEARTVVKRFAEKSLSCFLSISRAIAGETDVNRVLQRFACELSALLPHDHLDIVMLGQHGQQACYEVGQHTAWSRRSDPTMLTRDSPIRSLLWGDLPNMLTDDAWNDERFHFPGADSKPIFEAVLRSRVIVPLRVRGTITGSLAISRREVAAYDKRSLQIAQNAADLLAPYLFALEQGEQARNAAVAESEARASEEMLRLGALRLTEGMERERQRIAMDIHDQTLADLARLSRRLARMIGNGKVNMEDLIQIEGDLSLYLDELRGTVEDLKPGILHLFGFSDAVEAHLLRCASNTSPPISTCYHDSTGGLVDQLPENIVVSLYRIVQEATNNAVRHSEAARVAVEVSSDADIIEIRVRDDGIGIGARARAAPGGFGHMRTRAALISAELRVESAGPGCGTAIVVRKPIGALNKLSPAADDTSAQASREPAEEMR